MKILKEKKKASSMKSLYSFIQCIMSSPTHFSYAVVQDKVCEVETEATTPAIKKCL